MHDNSFEFKIKKNQNKHKIRSRMMNEPVIIVL